MNNWKKIDALNLDEGSRLFHLATIFGPCPQCGAAHGVTCKGEDGEPRKLDGTAHIVRTRGAAMLLAQDPEDLGIFVPGSQT